VPAEISLRDAAVLAIAYMTAYHALRDKANLQRGQTILILGASGGTGSAAIELAKAMGAKVIAAAGTQEKLIFCKGAGADELINYNTEDLKARVTELTGKKGVDVVFDPVGDKYAEPALRSLGYGGKYLVVGFAGGEIPKFPANLALLSERSIIGVHNAVWAPRAGEELSSAIKTISGWTKIGILKPKITKTYSLDNLIEGLHFATTRNSVGKILVEINPNLG
jgi:NADPH2:quinone reductase